MEFSELLQQKTKEADAICRAALMPAEGRQKTVLDAMRYALEAGGKRIRPLLMQESFALFCPDAQTEQIMRPALHACMAAMEMIHTFSLCHDDLPCMDNDRYRRGQLSTWAKYGEDMGTLAGDALSLYAFEAASNACLQTDLSAFPAEQRAVKQEALMRALYLLAHKSGVYGMLGGQVVDVEMTGKALDEAQLMFIYRLKTGALLEGSMMIGALLAGADAQSLSTVSQIAQDVGVAFQIQDDILDETSTQEVLGKPIHSDAENEKTTYVTLYGLSQASAEVERLTLAAVQTLDSLPLHGDSSFLKELFRYLIHREK